MRLTVVILTWLGLASFATGDPPPAPDIRPVQTVVATIQSEGEPVSLTGYIRARTEENLAFRIDGLMIARPVNVGQVVKPGNLVAALDPKPEQDAFHVAQANYAAALAALHQATNDFRRQRNLVGEGATTQVQFDAAQEALLTASADVDAAAAQLHTAQDQFGYTTLLADASGAVIATGAEAGEVVRTGQTIVTIAQNNGADAVFEVPDILFRQVSANPLVSIALTDDPAIHTVGRVREVAPQADPVTRSYLVKVGLTEWPEDMRLGATVTGTVYLPAVPGIKLPATALTSLGGHPAVWVVDPKSHQVSLRPVELQREDSSNIFVTGGLQSGEIVVTAGVHALRPGQKVRLLGDAG